MMLAFIVGNDLFPSMWSHFARRARRKEMAGCLPDALDLLVICTNAGNSLGVSIRRVADETQDDLPTAWPTNFRSLPTNSRFPATALVHFKGLQSASTCLLSAR